MTTKERMKDFLASEGISEGAFEKMCGLSKGFVSNIGDSIRKKSIDKILKKFPHLDTVWLLTGSFNNTNTGNNFAPMGDNNNSTLNNVGNTISVTMPESGTQKIINPDGTVELQRIDPNDQSRSDEVCRLKQRIQDLERIITEKEITIQSKDDTIKTKDELISILKVNKQ